MLIVRLSILLAVSLHALAMPAQAAVTQVVFSCEAIYQPSRSMWARSVELELNDELMTAVYIDGQSVYTFNVNGTVVSTALDNERIQIDVAQLIWRSDFRGLAQAQGRCERITP